MGLAWVDISTGDFAGAAAGAGGRCRAAWPGCSPARSCCPTGCSSGPSWRHSLAEYRTAALALARGALRERRRAPAAGASLRRSRRWTASAASSAPRSPPAGVLVDYLETTQLGSLPRLRPAAAPGRRRGHGDRCGDQAQSRADPQADRRAPGLAAGRHRPHGDAGGRPAPGRWLAAPLTDPAAIEARLDMLQALIAEPPAARGSARTACGARPISSARCRGCCSAAAARAIWRPSRDGLIAAGGAAPAPGRRQPACRRGLRQAAAALGDHGALDRGAEPRAWRPELPLIARDGGFIAPGYRAGLDELRSLRDESRRLVLELEARYRGETGITSLKIRHNNVLGYYVETTATHLEKLTGNRRLHPPPDHGQADALHHGGAGRAGAADRQRRRQGAGPGARTVRRPGRSR